MPKLTHLLIILWLLTSYPILANEVVLRSPPTNANGEYIKELLTTAYSKLGIQIKWLQVNGARELKLASNNELSGALARVSSIEQQYPKLVRVDFPVLTFQLLKVSDRYRCGYCLNKDIRSIAYASGALIAEQYVEDATKHAEKFAVSNPQQLNAMIAKRRIDSVLLMNFQLDQAAYLNPYLLIDKVDIEVDYHYLSPENANLASQLETIFAAMKESGELQAIQIKYNKNSYLDSTILPERPISFIANNWTDYTNNDGTGIYWQLIDSVFKTFTTSKITAVKEEVLFQFLSGQKDILVGAYRSLPTNDAIFSHYHIDFEYPLVGFSYQESLLLDYKQRDGKLKICVLPDAGSFLFEELSFVDNKNILKRPIEECVDLLKNKSIDLIVTYQYHLPEQLKHFKKMTIIDRTPLFLAFQNTAHGRYLKEYFDTAILKMAIDGRLKKIFPSRETFKQAHITDF
ncbi:hypothetical protein HII17_05400 [Thalassotalea sp. M1531]|uniref:Solute-binding protein family 3/N-terminal domain-containing protein n=1 Tax=Thalassotalea algicola TaxID=2716224 RepID=A0A7Y0Q7F0_9GAMM|nr:hypothetical protein [Thalassotalea algicola]NMP30995.1 hypothetical protein [Thalassotalea algicola]